MSTPSTDRAAATKIIDAVVAAGWTLDYVDDGGDRVKVTTTREAWDAINAVDTATLYVRDAGAPGRYAVVLFVLGNEPFEVAADYSTTLAEPIESVTDAWDA